MITEKICVTGGSGFIGTNLLRILHERYPQAEVVSVDIRKPLHTVDGTTYVQCDVRDKKELFNALEGAQKIFHLAAIIGTHESFDDPYVVFGTNVGGTLNVLEYARENGSEVFVAGMPGIWNNPYSVSKDAAVRLAVSYHEAYGTKACSLRWYSVYGPYQYVSRYNKAVPTFVYNAQKGKRLPVYGDGNQIADFIYVDDALNAAIDMLEYRQWGKVFQCATGEGISVNRLAGRIIDTIGSESQIEHLPMRQGEPEGAEVVADIHEISDALPHFKPLSLDDGLQRTIAHYAEYPPLD